MMKKLLFLTNHDPFDTSYGAGQRSHLMWRALRDLTETDVLFFNCSEEKCCETKEIDRGMLYSLATGSTAIRDQWWNALESRRLTELAFSSINICDYDAVISRHVTPVAKVRLPESMPVLIDFDDPVYSVPWNAVRSLLVLGKELIKSFNQLLVRWKLRQGRLHNAYYLYVSSRDKNEFPYLNGGLQPNIPLISPGESHPHIPGDTKVIIFVGMMTYRPNIEAVDFFLKKVWPQILEQHPHALFRIIGKIDQRQKQKWQKYTNCIVEGFVKNVSEAYAEATLAVSPIFSGGGSNIKVPEALTYGCPVVTTEYSYSGWSDFLRRDVDILVSNTPKGFTDHCVSVLNDDKFAGALVGHGKQRVEAMLSFESFRNRLWTNLEALREMRKKGNPNETIGERM